MSRGQDADHLQFIMDCDASFRIPRAYTVAMALTEIGGGAGSACHVLWPPRALGGAHFARHGKNNNIDQGCAGDLTRPGLVTWRIILIISFVACIGFYPLHLVKQSS